MILKWNDINETPLQPRENYRNLQIWRSAQGLNIIKKCIFNRTININDNNCPKRGVKETKTKKTKAVTDQLKKSNRELPNLNRRNSINYNKLNKSKKMQKEDTSLMKAQCEIPNDKQPSNCHQTHAVCLTI